MPVLIPLFLSHLQVLLKKHNLLFYLRAECLILRKETLEIVFGVRFTLIGSLGQSKPGGSLAPKSFLAFVLIWVPPLVFDVVEICLCVVVFELFYLLVL